MEEVHLPFCRVCEEAIAETVHNRFGTPIISHIPASLTVNEACKMPEVFSIETVKPITNTLRVIWKLNGDTVSRNKEAVTIEATQLNEGDNTLSVEVFDTTRSIRLDEHCKTERHKYMISWTLIKAMPGMFPVTTSVASPPTCDNAVSRVYLEAGIGGIPPYSLSWSNGSDSSVSAGLSAGQTYTLTVTDSSGCDFVTTVSPYCMDSLEAPVTKSSTFERLAKADSSAGKINSIIPDFQLYPNPNSGTFVISTIESDGEISISNILGETIYSSKLISDNTRIDLSNQPDGIYHVHFKTEQGITHRELVIQK